jgi:2-polyprenyl-6-hydroxyphenyl methylase/3-demethylubiquinone-9 3-methyltransferase
VVDYQTFIASCAQLVRPGGVLIMTTLNRTMKSYLFAIVGAERVLQLLPRGTHQWQKFVKPSEMAAAFRGNRVEVVDSCGMVIQPIGWKWKLSASDLDVNYLMTGVRNV